jgi:hypothetical protein
MQVRNSYHLAAGLSMSILIVLHRIVHPQKVAYLCACLLVLISTWISLSASAQQEQIYPNSSLKVTNPPVFPYGIDIDVNYSGTWAREYGISYDSTGKLFSFGVYGNSGTLNYGYIGGSTTNSTSFQNTWMAFLPNGNIGVGTTNPQSLFCVEGTITAKQLNITQTGWSDYVFDSSYQRMPLRAVADYVHANLHLPGIPSASQLADSGLNVGAMQKLHMQKIEELTLYAIDADRKIRQLDSTNSLQQQTLTRLQVLLEQLQAQLQMQQGELDKLKETQNNH